MRLIAAIFSGMLVAITLISGMPIYLATLEKQSIQGAIESAVEKNSPSHLDLNIFLPFLPLESARINEADSAVSDSLDSTFGTVVTVTQRNIKTSIFSFSLSARKTLLSSNESHIPVDGATDDFLSKCLSIFETASLCNTDSAEKNGILHDGFFQHLTSLNDHVIYLEGKPPSYKPLRFVAGPMIEASIDAELADYFSIDVGDVIVATPSMDNMVHIGVKVVGIFKPIDETAAIWQGDSKSFTHPYPPSEDDTVTRPEDLPPYLAMFIQEKSLTQGIGSAYAGSVSNATWSSHVDFEKFKEWSRPEIEVAMDSLGEKIGKELPGSELRSGIQMILRQFGRQNFLSSAPLLLLMAVLSVSLIYFLFMLTNYLIPGRESDIALLKSRGTSTFGLLAQYSIEGLVLTAIAFTSAPFIAMGLIATLGYLPYFENISGGGMLPVRITPVPFFVAAGAGVLCFLVFVTPVVLSSRTSLIARRISTSRPPTVPFVQRYYLDILFLAVVGILYWEMKARGQISSGGLFGQEGVNEALLVAPVLLLVAVAMLFFRAFPLLVTYLAGESHALVTLIGFVSVLILLGFCTWGILTDEIGEWLIPAISSAIFALGLYLVRKTSNKNLKFFAVVLMTSGIGFLWMYLPDYMPPVALNGLWGASIVVPGIIFFFLLRYAARFTPAWIALTLWHMSRNPLQYSWLVLLLVLASGVAVLSATLGATLERSHKDRIKYRVAEDVRIEETWGGFLSNVDSIEELEAQYVQVEGVSNFTPALRREGTVGSGSGAFPFHLLAVEVGDFSPWTRPDFSSKPMDRTLQTIRPGEPDDLILFPKDATEIGMYTKPMGAYPLISIWLLVEDANGHRQIITLGRSGLRTSEWTRRAVPINKRLVQPLKIVSIQISEPGFGPSGTPGSILIDDLFAVKDGTDVVIESFENPNTWTVIPTSSVDSDSLFLSPSATVSGSFGVVFEFGKEANHGVRGIYLPEYGSALRVIASDSFLSSTGLSVGSYSLVEISGVLVIVHIVDSVIYFPTLDPLDKGFLLTDLNALISHLSSVNPRTKKTPNEIFLQLSVLGETKDLAGELTTIAGISGEVAEKRTMLAEVQNDPLISAGWKALTLVSIMGSLFMTTMGYLVYVVFLSERSRSEMGSLRSLGLSRIQTVGLVALEHSVIVAMGIGIGTWTGFQMTKLMVDSVAISESGGVVLPPPILTTDWSVLGIVAAMFTFVFLVSVTLLGKYLFSMNLGALARMEE